MTGADARADPFRAAPCVVWQFAGERRTIAATSANVERCFGYDPDTLVAAQRPFADLIHPDERDAVLTGLARRIESGEDGFRLPDFRLARADGSYCWVQAEFSWGPPAGLDEQALVGYLLDVDERHKAEESLRESEQRWVKAFRASPSFIAIIDATDGTYLDVNDSWLSSIGFSRDEVIGKTPQELSAWAEPGDWERMQAIIEKSGKARDFEAEIRTKAGETREFLLAADAVELEEQPRYLIAGHDITARKRAEAQVRHMATHDTLTNLPNRTLFMDRLSLAMAGARRSGRKVALMFIDLDGFKDVNDTHGHDAGDCVLQEVARRLLECSRQTDTAGRLGGDEFIAVMTELRSREDAAGLAEKLVKSLCEPYRWNGEELRISCSIGIAMFPDGGTTVDALVKRADTAMYAVKYQGKHHFRFAD